MNKKISVRFYRTQTGNEPVRNWLKSLSKEERFTIGTSIKIVEYGWPIGMPTCRSLGNGLFEVRINLSTNRIARVIFCVFDNSMILLHGFIKKTAKTPKSALDLAKDRKKQLETND
ncbi:MAG: type II toxin-antitoxin system RelE/ParE family toxin [Prochloraceae cyanobacterium]|nr:type II toxin-antitoxin system RelE/ParE family toxin [Prochloraceae cyanobacterium]